MKLKVNNLLRLTSGVYRQPSPNMASYLKSLNPIPSFPEYTGPYKVGTTDVEIPVSELDEPCAAPEDAADTVQFRVFYPCQQEEGRTYKQPSWLPSPQRAHVSAYSKFLGAGSALAEAISFFPNLLYHIAIPAWKNAPLLPPTTSSKRWPVMVFSHGLGGSRNAYSHICGSIASHGVIVFAPEHRDRSTAISYIREVPQRNDETGEKNSATHSKRTISYLRLPHVPSPEVEDARTAQLKIRLWEMGCIHDALLKIDQGIILTNLNTSSKDFLPTFTSKLDVHTPGSITYAGHSFGAATVTQLVKSVFYAAENSSAPKDHDPLFVPSARSAITSQITPNTPLVLLDIWCMPLRARKSRWLWDKPLPCYAPGGPGGSAVLAIESEAFFKWRVHLKATKRLLAPDPSRENGTAAEVGETRPPPHFYYPERSAHLSQSDFGVLFPWLTRRVFGCEEPERILRLNTRAILQLMRERGIEVGATSRADMELEGSTEKLQTAQGRDEEVTRDDGGIFDTEGGVRGWIFLSTDCGDLVDIVIDGEEGVPVAGTPGEAVKEGELMRGMQGTGERVGEKSARPGMEKRGASSLSVKSVRSVRSALSAGKA